MRAILILALFCSSCLSVPGGSDEPLSAEPNVEAPAQAKDDAPKCDFTALEFAVQTAERRVESGGLSAQLSYNESQSKVESAERKLADAGAALAHLKDYSIPARLGRKDLDIERSEGRLKEARAELAQIKAMYEGEEFAVSSKELVIARSERGVAFSERSLELSKQARSDFEAFDLAKEMRDAEQGVKDAQAGLKRAGLRLQETQFGIESKAREAQEGLRKAQAALEKARAKADA